MYVSVCGCREPADSRVSPLSASSAYFTTSESKAKFLTRYGRDMKQSEQLNGLTDNEDLQQKKVWKPLSCSFFCNKSTCFNNLFILKRVGK
jgi:hypothetical protein